MNYTPSTEVIEQISSAEKTLVVFSAEWCGPCKAMSPLLDKALNEGHSIYKINVDDNAEFAALHLVRAIPTLLLFEQGTQIKRHSGSFTSYKELEQFIAG